MRNEHMTNEEWLTVYETPRRKVVKTRPTTLSEDSAERKEVPLYTGVLRYFPAALAEVAKVSKEGNDKHNPGQPLHHARGKSGDHGDCLLRHLMDFSDKPSATEGASVAWRALAMLQEWLEENEGAPLAPGARTESEVLD